MPPTRTCPYCGRGYAPGARECPGCRFPDLDAPPLPPSPQSTSVRAAPPRARPRRGAAPERATCAHCGAAFPAARPACPECGSDAATGWKPAEELDHAAVELAEDDPEAYREALLGDRPGHVSLWGTRRVRNLVVLSLLLAAMIVPLLLALRHLDW